MGKKLTTEEFVSECENIHRDVLGDPLYDYSRVEYISATKPIRIICNKHEKEFEFEKTPNKHKNSKQGCPVCSGRYRWKTDEWVNAARLVHGCKYTYERTIYSKAKENVIITCRNQEHGEHGDFKQTPDDHKNGGHGCSDCANNELKTNEEWLEEAHAEHGDHYTYLTKYKNAKTPILMQCNRHPELPEFKQIPTKHVLNRQGCAKCGRISAAKKQTLPLEEVLQRCSELHGDKYDYSRIKEGVKTKDHVTIGCKRSPEKHGTFSITLSSHLHQISGCGKCAIEHRFFGKRTVQEYRESGEHTPALLYLIECCSETKDEKFYKIGITKKEQVELRYRSKSMMPYKYKVIKEKCLELADAYEKEQNILEKLKEYKYVPKRTFDGRTECLKENPQLKTQPLIEAIKGFMS